MEHDTFKTDQKVKITEDNGRVVEGTVLATTNYILLQVDGKVMPVLVPLGEIKSYEILPDFRIGDIWEVDGREYYVREYRGYDGMITIESFDKKAKDGYFTSRDHSMYDKLEDFMKLNPKLVRRK